MVFGYRPSGTPLPPTESAVAVPERAADVARRAAEFAAVDSARLLTHLSVLAHDSMAGRAPGTEGSRAARSFIVDQLQQAGLTPFGSSFEQPFTWEDSGAGVNVIGRLQGSGGDGVIVLTAHFDHLGIRDGQLFNGADDNASGTAAALEIARLVAVEPLRSTLVVALVDAEEVGLQGARAFVANPPVPLADVVLNVNLDMVSRSAGLLWASGAHHTPALRAPLERVAQTAPVRLRLGHDRPDAPEGDDWTNSSDHGPFHANGIPFVYFGVEDHPDYHQPTDDFENVVAGDYVNVVRTILAALRALDATVSPPPPASPE
jgi:hypothetical protein